jgi:hypothetical protein
MRRWKLGTWTFENLIAPPQVVSQMTTLVSSVSRRVVVRNDSTGYRAEMASRRKSMRNTIAKLRLFGRDHGEVRFVSDCRDDAVLRMVLDWKAQKFNGDKPIIMARGLQISRVCSLHSTPASG